MQDFSKGKIGRQIILFSIPIVLGNLFMQLYQIVDSVIVGQYLGKEALAAVGASTPVVFACISLVIGIGSGASVVISQYFGAKDPENVRSTSDTLHIFLLVMGVMVGLVGIFGSQTIFELLGLPAELIPMASDYLEVYLGGIFTLFGFNTLIAILRGVGDSVTPLYFLILSALLNVGLDLLFIVTFGWGVASAAWATVIATAVAYLAMVIYINQSKKIIFHINFFDLHFNRKIFKQCVDYGLPTGIQQAFVALGGVALMGIANGFGTDVIAGFSAAMRVDALAVIPSMSFAMALTSFTGQNIGAGRIDRVKKGLHKTLLFSSIVCLVITLIIVIFGHQIISLFTTDQAVTAYGTEYLVVVSSFYILFSTMFIINGMLRGAGAMIFTMFATLIALWAIRIPTALLLVPSIGASGIWWSIPIGWAIGMVASILYYRSGRWKGKSIFNKK
ncbi:MAG: MATE family efflux transporter [Mucinivorans sp.]